jgi:oligopeptidase B
MRLKIAGIAPPAPREDAVTKTVHGVRLTDEFDWMRAANWQEILADPSATPAEIRAYLDAENAYAKAALEPTDELRKTIAGELRGRIREDDSSVPVAHGPFDYYSRYRAGGQHRLFCRRPRGATEGETILIDGDALAEGKSFFHVADTAASPDHRLIAWSDDDAGSELHAIHVKDIASGALVDDSVRRCDGSIVWSQDGAAFYYVRVDDNHRTSQVFRHRLGQPVETDVLIVEEPDPGWFVHLDKSQSDRFAIVTMRDHDSAECWLIDLADPNATARIVSPRRAGVRYSIEHHEDDLFIRTNADGAEDFKIVTASLAQPDASNWRDLVPHAQGRLIVDGAVYKDFFVRLERENGLPRIVVRAMATGDEHTIAFAEEAYSLSLMAGEEYDTDIIRFRYSSMTTPEETYDYNMVQRSRVLRKRQEIPSGHDPKAYVTRRIFARTADGEEVPISLLARADLKKPAPCLLYAYGAYGHATPASFSANRFSLVDRGFVYAIAHVRGGTDKGWRWYENGKLRHKQNTFSDFICAARKLIADGWTKEKKIVAHGGSAGGMLMGAIANQAPELFAGIIADVPFVDVMNTMLDGELPLTPPEWLEWGNPGADVEAFHAILAYSPYDNVTAQNYPPILAFGGLTDPRVTYWEPAKWVARLRKRMTGGGPVMLVTNMEAGHGGASGRFDQLDETAQEQAFAIAVTDAPDALIS